MARWLVGTFAVLTALALLSWSPTILMYAFLLLLLPGLVLLFANTALYYFATAVLAGGITRLAGLRSTVATVVVIGIAVAIVAMLPAFIGRHLFAEFVAKATEPDFSVPSTLAPRSFDLPVQWVGWGRAGKPDAMGEHEAQPYCSRLCQALLYGNLADAVYVTISEDIEQAPDGRWVHPRRTWKFRAENIGNRESCPDLAGGIYFKFQQLAKGTCLISERVDHSNADVLFGEDFESEEYRGHILGNSNTARSGHLGLAIWNLSRPIKVVQISERMASGMKPVERRTEINGRVPPLPFYVGAVGRMDMRICVASMKIEVNHTDLAEILKRRYGIELPAEADPDALRLKR